MTTVYISGPMTGYPLLNFERFYRAADELANAGYRPLNPAALYGGDTPEEAHRRAVDMDLPYHEFLRQDLFALLTCTHIALLPGWEKSNGAQLELTVARGVGIEEFEFEWSFNE